MAAVAIPPSPSRINAVDESCDYAPSSAAAAPAGRKQVVLRAAAEPLSEQEVEVLKKTAAALGDCLLKIYVLDNHELEMNSRGAVRVRGQATVLDPDAPIGSADLLLSERGPGCIMIARCGNVSDNAADLARSLSQLADSVPVHSNRAYDMNVQREIAAESYRSDPVNARAKDAAPWEAELGSHGHCLGL